MWGHSPTHRAQGAVGATTVARFGEALAAAGPGPAAGSTAAVTTSLAAGLATKVARAAADREAVTPDLAEELARLRRRALVLADDDVAAYSRFLAARRAGNASVEEIVQVPSDVVAVAVRVAEVAGTLAQTGPDHLVGDAVTAALLAAAAAEAAATLVGANLADGAEVATRADPRAEHAEERAGEARAVAERLL